MTEVLTLAVRLGLLAHCVGWGIRHEHLKLLGDLTQHALHLVDALALHLDFLGDLLVRRCIGRFP